MNFLKKLSLICLIACSGFQVFAKPSVQDFAKQIKPNDSVEQFEQLVKRFVQEGGDINEKCENETLLGVCMAYGYFEYVKILLNYGAKANDLVKNLSKSFVFMESCPELAINIMKAINCALSTMSEKDRNKQLYEGLSGFYVSQIFSQGFVQFHEALRIASELLITAINNNHTVDFETNLVEFNKFFHYLIDACRYNNDEEYCFKIGQAASQLSVNIHTLKKNSTKAQCDQLRKIETVASEIYKFANNLA